MHNSISQQELNKEIQIMSQTITPFLISNITYHIPIYLVWLVGIILACSNRKRHPQASLFTLLAIASMFIFSLISMYVGLIPIIWRDRGYTLLHISMITGTANILLAILNACSYGLLLAAIFVERKASVSAENMEIPQL
jgi:hypothetical protein